MEIWKANEEVMGTARKLIAEHHPDLALVDKEIAILFREKGSKSGGRVVLGRSKKAPSILSVLGDTDYKFVIEIAADEWAELSMTQRKALLDHHLCACRVEEDEKSGELKHFIVPPDFVGYRDEIDRWGMWRPVPEDEFDNSENIEKMFTE